MKFSPAHLKRYKEIASLFWKYGRSDLVQHMHRARDFEVPEFPEMTAETSPERLTDDLEAMGPTYVKLGQVLAGRPDLLPETYLKALARLQNSVKPFSAAEAEQIVASELGVRLSKAFSRFDPEPLGAASLGQVHAAALRDGREVVVKVQRPDIRRQVAEDFEVLEQIASLLDEHTEIGRRYRFSSLVEEFRLTLNQELNYELEAQNLRSVGKNLKEFDLLFVPQPISDYCTRSLLTMEFVPGKKITELTPLARLDLKAGPLIEQLFKAYLKQILVDGLFHADPHPGNVFIMDDGRLALLDLGMVGRTAPGMQEHLLKLLLAVSEGNGEEAAEIVVQLSEKREGFNYVEFRRMIARLVAARRDQGLHQMNVGQSLLDVSRSAGESGLFVPSELTLLGKTLLQLDQVGQILDPEFDPNAVIRRHVGVLMSQRMRQNISQGHIFRSLLEVKDFVGHLPGRLNRIMDAVSNSELEVKVKAVDAKLVLDGMEKIANRITAGVILAALIVGASLLMRVETSFRIFGYPGFAMLCFLAAATGGTWLLASIFIQDYRSRKKKSF